MNPFQPDLTPAAIARPDPGPTVRVATDKDQGGAGFAVIIEGLVAKTGRGDPAVERATPVDAKD